MNRMLKGWTWIRFIYFIIGGGILMQSLLSMEWIGILFGVYFAAMGLFGFGCAAGQCYSMKFGPMENKNR